MDELLKQISDKLGIKQDVARKVVLVVANYVKSKVPESVAGEIDLALDMKDITEEEMRFVGLFKFP
jgi:HEPN domain-containing protein